MSTIIRWNPLREMAVMQADMQNAMNRLFDDTWRTMMPSVDSRYVLPVDIHETDQGYTLLVDVPGVKQDQINITLNQNVLTLSVELPQPTLAEGQRSLLAERTWGKFTRSLTLPRPVNSEAVEAVYTDGVLTLTLPVAPEAQPKRISVKPGGSLLRSSN